MKHKPFTRIPATREELDRYTQQLETLNQELHNEIENLKRVKENFELMHQLQKQISEEANKLQVLRSELRRDLDQTTSTQNAYIQKVEDELMWLHETVEYFMTKQEPFSYPYDAPISSIGTITNGYKGTISNID